MVPGTQVGRYEILAFLGAGGMGEVYRARDLRLGREVALKLLARALVDDEMAQARFEVEMRAVAAVSHSNVLAIFDVGTESGVSYAVMELLDGETLRRKLAAGALSVPQAVEWGTQIAFGLAAAHERSVVHRDLKPENVFVTAAGQVKVLDFGLARFPGLGAGDRSTLHSPTGVTTPGTVLGTVGYMSPEQVRGGAVDQRSDLFALGALLYEMLTGQRAFDGASAIETLHGILHDEPPRLTSVVPGLPAALADVVHTCLEKSPARRYQAAQDVARALRAVASSSSGPAPGRVVVDSPAGHDVSPDPDAVLAFERGELASDGLASSDPRSLRRAIDSYEEAVALDPRSARAWAQLSRACALLFFTGAPDKSLTVRAREAAERALAIAPDRAEGFLAMGDYLRWACQDPARALDQYLQGWRRAPGMVDLLAAAALAEQGLGRWEQALHYLRQAQQLDPASVSSARRLGFGLLWLRRHDEARAVFARGLALAPDNLTLLAYRAVTFLAVGDLAGARASLRVGSSGALRLELLAFLASFGELWVFEEDQRELLRRLTPRAFDDDVGKWALCQAQLHELAGDPEAASTAAREAEAALREKLRDTPGDGWRLAELGLALSLAGRDAEAIAAGENAAIAIPPERDAYIGPYLQHQLVKVLLRANRWEGALDLLEELLRVPYHLSPGWLRIDPTFDCVRGNSRFGVLIGA